MASTDDNDNPSRLDMLTELVLLYDVLDSALELAINALEQLEIDATDQASFWRTYLALDARFGQEYTEWLWSDRPKGVDAPLTGRRVVLEGWRRLEAGEAE